MNGIFYHGTHSGASFAIEKEGLQWQPHDHSFPDEGGAYPYLTNDMEAAEQYASEVAQQHDAYPVVYRITELNLNYLDEDTYHNELNDQGILKGRGWEYTGAEGIPARNIARVIVTKELKQK